MRKDGQTRPRYPFVWRTTLEECNKHKRRKKGKFILKHIRRLQPPSLLHIPLTNSQYNSENNWHPGNGAWWHAVSPIIQTPHNGRQYYLTQTILIKRVTQRGFHRRPVSAAIASRRVTMLPPWPGWHYVESLTQLGKRTRRRLSHHRHFNGITSLQLTQWTTSGNSWSRH